MGMLEQKIRDFVKEQGIALVGLAGPDRLAGPPSLDPTYTMKGAKSIVSLVVPIAGHKDHVGSIPQAESTVETPASLEEGIPVPVSAVSGASSPADTIH